MITTSIPRINPNALYRIPQPQFPTCYELICLIIDVLELKQIAMMTILIVITKKPAFPTPLLMMMGADWPRYPATTCTYDMMIGAYCNSQGTMAITTTLQSSSSSPPPSPDTPLALHNSPHLCSRMIGPIIRLGRPHYRSNPTTHPSININIDGSCDDNINNWIVGLNQAEPPRWTQHWIPLYRYNSRCILKSFRYQHQYQHS